MLPPFRNQAPRVARGDSDQRRGRKRFPRTFRLVGQRVLISLAINLKLPAKRSPLNWPKLRGLRPRRKVERARCASVSCQQNFQEERQDKMQILLVLAFIAALAGSASAQNCNTYGSSTRCDNGLSSQRLGNFTYWSNGFSSQRVGSSTYNSDGSSSQRIGNSTYYSNGASSQTLGNTTYFSNGRSCHRAGNSVHCD